MASYTATSSPRTSSYVSHRLSQATPTSEAEAVAEPVLIDFGLSAVWALGDATIARHVGTCLCMAPKVVRGASGAAADVWAVGVIAYVLLTGSASWRTSSDEAMMAEIAACSRGGGSCGAPQLRDLEFSAQARQAVQTMLTLDPRKRPSARATLALEWFDDRAHLAMVSPAECALTPPPPPTPTMSPSSPSTPVEPLPPPPPPPPRICGATRRALDRYARASRLQRLARIIAVASGRLPPRAVESLLGAKREFREIDRDGDGYISWHEFRRELLEDDDGVGGGGGVGVGGGGGGGGDGSGGVKRSAGGCSDGGSSGGHGRSGRSGDEGGGGDEAGVLAVLWRALDVRGDGRVSVDQWLAAQLDERALGARAGGALSEHAFASLDADGSGTISAANLARLLGGEARAREALEPYDRDGDGELSRCDQGAIGAL